MDFFKTLWSDLYGIFGERVELGTNSVTTLNIIVWSLFAGFIIAIAVTVYNKVVLGKIVRALIAGKAFTPECALGAAEVGCDNASIRFAQRKKSTMRRIVRMTDDTDMKLSDKGFDKAKFYIPEEYIPRAESFYGRSDISAKTVALSVIGLLAVAIVAFIFIPDIIQLIANFIEGITPTGNDNIL